MNRQTTHSLYEDQDGLATEASTKAFSDQWQRWVLALLSAIWFGCALSATTITLVPPQSQLLVPVWLLGFNSVSYPLITFIVDRVLMIVDDA